ncbi:ATP-binding protein [Streptomyces prunicolor]|jgi:anti-sigma regulatory factor (Ser/Thr protein kinase)|uniref:ATP-binding protein n=1 Tax=Streptomyces prunicolor TaxID=67348 RepID=UPI00386EC2A1|nr:ATP-binding protein [Streptomyces prunicolor]
MHTQSPPEVVLQLLAEPEGFAAARQVVREQLTAWGYPEFADAATLCVTEMLANVHRHVKSPECKLHLRVLPEGGVRVAVADRSPELPVWYTEPDWDTESGRGIFLIASVAGQWGVTPRQGRRGKQVWAEFTAVKS